MTELELYNYIYENGIEWRWDWKDGNPDVLIFPYTFQIEEFSDLIKSCTDDGVECRLMNGYFAIWMLEICDRYGIELEKVFPE